jgi:hypothetical protein
MVLILKPLLNTLFSDLVMMLRSHCSAVHNQDMSHYSAKQLSLVLLLGLVFKLKLNWLSAP